MCYITSGTLKVSTFAYKRAKYKLFHLENCTSTIILQSYVAFISFSYLKSALTLYKYKINKKTNIITLGNFLFIYKKQVIDIICFFSWQS